MLSTKYCEKKINLKNNVKPFSKHKYCSRLMQLYVAMLLIMKEQPHFILHGWHSKTQIVRAKNTSYENALSVFVLLL